MTPCLGAGPAACRGGSSLPEWSQTRAAVRQVMSKERTSSAPASAGRVVLRTDQYCLAAAVVALGLVGPRAAGSEVHAQPPVGGVAPGAGHAAPPGLQPAAAAELAGCKPEFYPRRHQAN
jgi:hypothetical protein